MKNQLPKRFGTWYELYLHCCSVFPETGPLHSNSASIVIDDTDERLSFRENCLLSHSRFYDVDVDFLKARVLDEIIDFVPERKDFLMIFPNDVNGEFLFKCRILDELRYGIPADKKPNNYI